MTSPQKEILDKVKHELPGQVTAVITADASAPVGQPFNLNIRLDLPRIMTHTYQADLPPSQMFDEYEDVKVTIPLPKGVTAVDKNYLDTSGKNLVVEFPKLYDGDFEGQTNKGKDIKLKLLDNGGVANGEEFIFSGAKWSLDTDVYLDKTENPRREKINITGDIPNMLQKQVMLGGFLKHGKRPKKSATKLYFPLKSRPASKEQRQTAANSYIALPQKNTTDMVGLIFKTTHIRSQSSYRSWYKLTKTAVKSKKRFGRKQ